MPTGARTAAAAADLYLEGEEEEEDAIRKRRGALCVRPAESIAIECYNAWAREGPPASYPPATPITQPMLGESQPLIDTWRSLCVHTDTCP